jgi:hypothetical protein
VPAMYESGRMQEYRADQVMEVSIDENSPTHAACPNQFAAAIDFLMA